MQGYGLGAPCNANYADKPKAKGYSLVSTIFLRLHNNLVLKLFDICIDIIDFLG